MTLSRNKWCGWWEDKYKTFTKDNLVEMISNYCLQKTKSHTKLSIHSLEWYLQIKFRNSLMYVIKKENFWFFLFLVFFVSGGGTPLVSKFWQEKMATNTTWMMTSRARMIPIRRSPLRVFSTNWIEQYRLLPEVVEAEKASDEKTIPLLFRAADIW